MVQTNKTCSICKELGHSKFYCKKKPVKTIPRSTIKKKVNVAKYTKPVKVVKKKKSPLSRGQIVRKLDSIFSQYIRLRDSESGESTCVTCGIEKSWKEQQCGHFFTRGRYPTRWHEKNCHVQCYRCNILLKGNYINYTRFMIDTYGREFVDELERVSSSITKIPTPQLREMIEYYKKLVEQMS